MVEVVQVVVVVVVAAAAVVVVVVAAAAVVVVVIVVVMVVVVVVVVVVVELVHGVSALFVLTWPQPTRTDGRTIRSQNCSTIFFYENQKRRQAAGNISPCFKTSDYMPSVFGLGHARLWRHNTNATNA